MVLLLLLRISKPFPGIKKIIQYEKFRRLINQKPDAVI